MAKRSQEILEQIGSTCIPRMNDLTVPILTITNERICHNRTGVLYRIGDRHFVLTAAHKLRAKVENNTPLYVSVNAENVDPIPLAGATFVSSDGDERDVAAIYLPPDLAQEIGKNKTFLRHHQISHESIQRRTPYVIFGYPGDWSGHVIAEKHIMSMGMAFATFEHEGEIDTDFAYRPEVHLAVTFTRDAIKAIDGQKDKLPKPLGVSGCGIWQVADRNENGIRVRTADTMTLMGIQHNWSPRYGYVLATKIGYLLAIINQQFPDTAELMRLIYKA